MVRVPGGWMSALLAVAGFVVAGCDTAPAPVTPSADHDHDHGHGDGHGHKHADDHDHKHADGHDHDHAGEDGEHAHADHPETYAIGVKELAELNDKIRDAFAKDDTKAADVPVHEFGHVLEEIVPLAEKAKVTGDDLAAVKKAVEQLFDDFEKVDTKIHGGEGKTYAEVETQVGEALATLKKYVPTEM